MRDKLFLSHYISIDENIKIAIPTVSQVYQYEEEFNLIAHHLTATPFSRMAELWLNHIDYINITFEDLFIQAILELKTLSCGSEYEVSKIFGYGVKPCPKLINLFFIDLDIENLFFAKDDVSNQGVIINRRTQNVIFSNNNIEKVADVFRRLLCETKDNYKEDIGGESGRYVRDRAVKVYKRKIKKILAHPRQYSMIESCIVMAVNQSGFSYNFETVMSLKYISFLLSINQLKQNKRVDNIAIGIYTGNIEANKLTNQDQNYFSLEE